MLRRDAHTISTTCLAIVFAAIVGPTPVIRAQDRATEHRSRTDVEANTSEYAIGAEDVLGIMVWRETELSLDVIVRPDGYITMPLLNDVLAAGKRPSELKEHLQQLLRVYVKDPNVTVIVRQINSRKVSITGRVMKPGSYPLLGPMRALDLVAKAGGLAPTADPKHLSVLRTDRGERISLPLDYTEVTRGLRVWQDVVLRPGDTVVVP